MTLFNAYYVISLICATYIHAQNSPIVTVPVPMIQDQNTMESLVHPSMKAQLAQI